MVYPLPSTGHQGAIRRRHNCGEIENVKGGGRSILPSKENEQKPEAILNWRNGCADCGHLKKTIHAIQDEADAFRYAMEHMVSFEGTAFSVSSQVAEALAIG